MSSRGPDGANGGEERLLHLIRRRRKPAVRTASSGGCELRQRAPGGPLRAELRSGGLLHQIKQQSITIALPPDPEDPATSVVCEVRGVVSKSRGARAVVSLDICGLCSSLRFSPGEELDRCFCVVVELPRRRPLDRVCPAQATLLVAAQRPHTDESVRVVVHSVGIFHAISPLPAPAGSPGAAPTDLDHPPFQP